MLPPPKKSYPQWRAKKHNDIMFSGAQELIKGISTTDAGSIPYFSPCPCHMLHVTVHRPTGNVHAEDSGAASACASMTTHYRTPITTAAETHEAAQRINNESTV